MKLSQRNLVAKHMNTFCKATYINDKRDKINEKLDEVEMYRVSYYEEIEGNFINDITQDLIQDLEEEENE